jgi:uncharacterized protein
MTSEAESLCFHEEDPVSNRSSEPAFVEILDRVMTRRRSIQHLAGWAGLTTLSLNSNVTTAASFGQTGLTFQELARGFDESARVANGYEWQVIAAWGDPIFPDAVPLDVHNQNGESQSKQFGYNCDYIAFIALPSSDPNVERGLLCVNHEYTDTNLMFPGLKTREDLVALPKEIVEAEMAAMGHSVVDRPPDIPVCAQVPIPPAETSSERSTIAAEASLRGARC